MLNMAKRVPENSPFRAHNDHSFEDESSVERSSLQGQRWQRFLAVGDERDWPADEVAVLGEN